MCLLILISEFRDYFDKFFEYEYKEVVDLIFSGN